MNEKTSFPCSCPLDTHTSSFFHFFTFHYFFNSIFYRQNAIRSRHHIHRPSYYEMGCIRSNIPLTMRLKITLMAISMLLLMGCSQTTIIIESFPPGAVIMWNGSTSDIPSGWKLCDGNDNTINLTDRFVLGAGGNYSVGSVGGSAVTTLNTSHIPPHSHNLRTFFDGFGFELVLNPAIGAGQWQSGLIQNTGGGQPFSTMPPYHALLFLCKS